MFKLDDKVQVTGIKEAIRAMNKIEPETVKAMRTEMKGKLDPTAKKIASQIPTNPPLSGMRGNGRTRWNGARGAVSFTPAKIRQGSDVHPLVSITTTGRGNAAGYDIAEIAGSRNLQFSKDKRRGRQFIRALDSRAPWKYKAGRFGFGYFLRERKNIVNIAVEVLDKYAKEFNKKVD